MESPPPERPHPEQKRRRSAASVVAASTVTLVVLATGASIAVADHGAPYVLGGSAARYVPADGHVEWVLDQDNTLRMSESARSIGYAQLLLLPASAGSSILNGMSDDEAHTAQLWRESSTTVPDDAPGAGDGTGNGTAQSSDLHRLSTEGLSLLASSGGSVGFAYSPALLELPASVAPGSRWSSKGDALPNGLVTYTASYTAAEPSYEKLLEASGLGVKELARCLQTTGGSEYKDSSGVTLIEITETDLWCEGRGRVAIVATVNGAPVVQGPSASPQTDRASPEAASPVRWLAPGSWTVGEADFGYPDEFFGAQKLTVALANSPVRTAGGLVVAANQTGDDLTALRQKDGAFAREWIAHPGGEIIGIGTVGDVVIATTSLRQVVAYSSGGARLWTMDTPELVLAGPVDAGDGKVVIVGLDGTVASVDATSGEQEWSRKLDADVGSPAIVAGKAVVLVDRAGHITAFDRSTGKTLWSKDGEPASAAVASDSTDGSGNLVVIVGDDGFARAFDSRTGDRRWEVRYSGTVGSALAVDGLVVLASEEQVLGVDGRTGTVAWQRQGADGAISDGRVLVLLESDIARIVDASGVVEKSWSIPPLSTAVYRYGVAGSNGFWIFRSNQPATTIGHPDD